jgi:hypothetical protein
MTVFKAMLVGAITVLTWAPAADAQDATSTTPTQTQTQTVPDSSSPLTPSNDNSSPLTPNTTNPISGQSQSRTVSSSQSSSEVPARPSVIPIEANRIDPSADINLRLAIDPASMSAAQLSPNANGLAPVTAGVSLNSVQGATSLAPPKFPVNSFIGLSSPNSLYPAKLTTLGNRSFGRAGGAVRASSTAMGPLIGSAAVAGSSALATTELSAAPATQSTFMRAPGSSTIIRPATLSHPQG